VTYPDDPLQCDLRREVSIMIPESYALMGKIGLAVLAIILLSTLGVLLFKGITSLAKSVILFIIGLIRLPFDMLLRFFRDDR